MTSCLLGCGMIEVGNIRGNGEFMYLNLQLGNFHIVLGNLAEQAAQEEPAISPVFTRVSPSEEFFLDDETKLRYQNHQQSI